MSDNEGSQRLLTLGEIALAKSIFGNSIVYPRVWIHHASYFPFKLQGRNTAMSPNGELYFRDWYCENFSIQSFQFQHLFIHEMSHVWQYQRGIWVRMRGLVSGFVSYEYSFEENKKLFDQNNKHKLLLITFCFLNLGLICGWQDVVKMAKFLMLDQQTIRFIQNIKKFLRGSRSNEYFN